MPDFIVWLISSRKVQIAVKKSKNRYELIANLIPVFFQEFVAAESTETDKKIEKARTMFDLLGSIMLENQNGEKNGLGSNLGDRIPEEENAGGADTSQ